MDILNLKPGFAPLGAGTIFTATNNLFPGGEVNLRLSPASVPEQEVMIATRLNTSHNIIELIMATNALRGIGYTSIHVFAPYLPYARQDRCIRVGEAFSLQAFAQVINVQGYASVRVFEAHSDVASREINGLVSINNRRFIELVLADKRDCWIVYPDKGASMRYESGLSGLSNLVCVCDKKRGTTGAVDDISLSVEDFDGRDVLIVDDICDGGGTFIGLAKHLRTRNTGRINLAVAHGIFSHGESVLQDNGIDHVYTTDSLREIHSPFTTQVKLCCILTPITTGASRDSSSGMRKTAA